MRLHCTPRYCEVSVLAFLTYIYFLISISSQFYISQFPKLNKTVLFSSETFRKFVGKRELHALKTFTTSAHYTIQTCTVTQKSGIPISSLVKPQPNICINYTSDYTDQKRVEDCYVLERRDEAAYMMKHLGPAVSILTSIHHYRCIEIDLEGVVALQELHHLVMHFPADE